MTIKEISSRLEIKVIIAIVLAILTGIQFPEVLPYISWMGEIFMRLLKVFLGPLLFFSIFTAVIGLGDLTKLGKIGVRTFTYYMMTTTLAITLSLVAMNIFQPGSGLEFKEFASYDNTELQKLTFVSFLLWLIPNNFMTAFIELNAMQIVTTGIILGIFVLVSAKSTKKINELKSIVDTINGAILAFIGFVVKLTPLGVFWIVTKVVVENGVDSIISLLPFVLVVIGTLFIHALISLPVLWYFVWNFKPFEYMAHVREAILLGFSTSSSSATMPVSMKVAHEKAGLSKEVVDFTFPIGATVNMDGTAIYQAGVAIFVAQVIWVDLSVIQQLTIVIIIIMASIGAAGVPGAGILILATVFLSIGLPIEAIGIILAVDRILDMFRTGVNVWWDLLTAKVVDCYYTKHLEEKSLADKIKWAVVKEKIS